jgi:formamidopyrimidine-DNA glycosylase
MPELPEVETIRRDLEKEVGGKRVKAVEVLDEHAVRRHGGGKDFAERLEGRKIQLVTRRGKWLIFELDADDTLAVHLGTSGQLRKCASKDQVEVHTQVVISFTVGGQLRFIDSKTSGELFVSPTESLGTDVAELGELGFDPIEDIMSWNAFGAMLLGRKGKLKALLVDQKFVAGIGNLYSDEILWAAGLRYDRSSETLSTQEVRRLYRSIGEVLNEAIKLRGSTLADQQYLDLHGDAGKYQSEHKVYGREGEACRRCRQPVLKAKWSGRSTFFCGACQV